VSPTGYLCQSVNFGMMISNVWNAETLVWLVRVTVANVTRGTRSMPTKFQRKQIKLHPEVMIKLEEFKEVIHNYASPQSLRAPDKEPLRRPLSWNEFFMMIISDWEGSQMKCHCGKFYHCDHCRMVDEVSRRRSHGFDGQRWWLSVSSVDPGKM